MLKQGQVIAFNKSKYFKYIKPLGSGGTGDTYLFEDETTDSLFAIKKYSPKSGNDIDENYERFVHELKILFSISHKNVVRIYNHYLYPENKTGYIQMEYIDGTQINKFSPYEGNQWNDIFFDVISAFSYLEDNRILHRDIRPENILIDLNGNAKIIDFGFGKKIEQSKKSKNSIAVLNWPVSEPPFEVMNSGTYNHQTESFFIGKLFENMDLSKNREGFRYANIIGKMSEKNPQKRYKTFKEVLNDISKGEFAHLRFTNEKKEIYQEFAASLINAIASFHSELDMERDTQKILYSLSEVLRISSFEYTIQDNSALISCFMNQGYSYFDSTKKGISCETLHSFYDLLTDLSPREQDILLDNLYTRFKKIKVKEPAPAFPSEMDSVPF